MHLSNKQRLMNKTYIVLSNKYCSSYNDNDEQDQSNFIIENNSQLSTTLDNTRFSTFTKYKIKHQPTKVSVNQDQKRYFDSPTMITLDDDENDIPLIRCSNKRSITNNSELSLNETELSDLLMFTNPNRILTESMHVVISRHPSLEEFKYVNDISSVLIEPQDSQEPIYQELIRLDQLLSTPPRDHMNDIDENKENQPPIMPNRCLQSRIPILTPSTNTKNIHPSTITSKNKKTEALKQKPTTKQCLTDLLDEWSYMGPKIKELLSNTRKIPLRIPELTKNTIEFRRLKQLLNDLEMTTSSWTNAINQCRYVLQHAQQQIHRS